MRRGSGFGYFIKEGILSMIKNGVMSIASIGVLIACLIIMGSFLLASSNIKNILKDIEDQNEIVVFVDTSVTSEQIETLKAQIKGIEHVRDLAYISKEQAFENYKSSIPDGEQIFEGIDDNPLRDSFCIYLEDISAMQTVINKLEQIPQIAKVRGRTDISANLIKLEKMLSFVMLWFLVILVGISVFIISNTIKAAVFARRKEINIMKNVGATDWFIRWPFIIEGILIGAISAAVAFVAQMYIYIYLMEKVFEGINIFTLMPFAYFIPYIGYGFFGTGILIGSLSSLFSIKKYLKT